SAESQRFVRWSCEPPWAKLTGMARGSRRSWDRLIVHPGSFQARLFETDPKDPAHSPRHPLARPNAARAPRAGPRPHETQVNRPCAGCEHAARQTSPSSSAAQADVVNCQLSDEEGSN